MKKLMDMAAKIVAACIMAALARHWGYTEDTVWLSIMIVIWSNTSGD